MFDVHAISLLCLQALEIGAGTGRFATFVKDNYPALQLTVSDLSPFYLSEARSNMQVPF